jgi:hypothetical protein
MDAAQVQQRTQHLSADDGDIRQALEALEGKLGAWFKAYSSLAEPRPAEEQSVAPVTPKGLLVRDEAMEALTETVAEPESEPGATSSPEVEQPSAAERDAGMRMREEDELLLSTLAPEVTTAIRIKRRLDGGSRSVRELLDEYEQEKETIKNESQSKRWWR